MTRAERLREMAAVFERVMGLGHAPLALRFLATEVDARPAAELAPQVAMMAANFEWVARETLEAGLVDRSRLWAAGARLLRGLIPVPWQRHPVVRVEARQGAVIARLGLDFGRGAAVVDVQAADGRPLEPLSRREQLALERALAARWLELVRADEALVMARESLN